jgi:hypothetical protein
VRRVAGSRTRDHNQITVDKIANAANSSQAAKKSGNIAPGRKAGGRAEALTPQIVAPEQFHN